MTGTKSTMVVDPIRPPVVRERMFVENLTPSGPYQGVANALLDGPYRTRWQPFPHMYHAAHRIGVVHGHMYPGLCTNACLAMEPWVDEQ